jgi:ABC-type transporter lipoprotein component MlaA
VFQRDAYLQRRRSLIYDGHAPRQREPEDESETKNDGKKPD